MDRTEKLIDDFIAVNGSNRQNLLPLLQRIIEVAHFLNEKTLRLIAEKMELSAADVYGTASFYSFLDVVPRGRHMIRICKNITCFMSGKDQIIAAIEHHLGVTLGGTTVDGSFSFLPTNCIGSCHEGPAMLIDNHMYSNLTPESAIAAINQFTLSEVQQ